MIILCQTCRHPIILPDTHLMVAGALSLDAACPQPGCGAIYRVAITELRESALKGEELRRRGNFSAPPTVTPASPSPKKE